MTTLQYSEYYLVTTIYPGLSGVTINLFYGVAGYKPATFWYQYELLETWAREFWREDWHGAFVGADIRRGLNGEGVGFPHTLAFED